MIRWAIVVAVACPACDQATLVTLPDASDQDACTMHAVEFCDASASGCLGGGADAYVSLLPSDASFAVGCNANVIGTDRDPVSGVCKLAATCTCTAVDDAGAAAWICSP